MDPVWEAIFSTRSWGKYPSISLVQRVMRAYRTLESRQQAKVLELGCGAGANLSFFLNEGFQTYGLDGAPSAIKQAKVALEDKASPGQTFELIESTFEAYDFPKNKYDLIVDCLAISTNTIGTIKETYQKSYEALKQGGYFYSHVWGARTEGADTGEIIEPRTSKNPTSGPSKNLGITHFFDLTEINELFENWSSVEITNHLSVPAGAPEQQIEEWIIWASK